jgi:hypothetical protein
LASCGATEEWAAVLLLVLFGESARLRARALTIDIAVSGCVGPLS